MNKYICTPTDKHTHTHTHKQISTHLYNRTNKMYTCIYRNKHMGIPTHTHIQTHAHTHTHTYIYIYMLILLPAYSHTGVPIHILACIHMFTYIRT